MKRRIYDPFGKRDRQRYPDKSAANGTGNPVTQTSPDPSGRTLKVEHLEGTCRNPSGKALLRLKGKWLAQIFAPDSRVSVKVEQTRIVIERAEQ